MAQRLGVILAGAWIIELKANWSQWCCLSGSVTVGCDHSVSSKWCCQLSRWEAAKEPTHAEFPWCLGSLQMFFWREGWSLRQDFTAPDFISCFYLDLEGVACGSSCLHSITPAVGGRMSCCWARFDIPSQSWTLVWCEGNVGMAFPTHSLNESCCQDWLWEQSLAWEAVIKWKRSHASTRWNWDMNHALRPSQNYPFSKFVFCWSLWAEEVSIPCSFP